MKRFAAAVLVLAFYAAPAWSAEADAEYPFTAATAGEAIVVVHASCAPCSWRETGREAAVLQVLLDGRYSQHLMLVRGEDAADYRIAVGTVTAGAHRLSFSRDAALSAPGAGRIRIAGVEVTVAPGDTPDALALSMAPVLFARANTVGHFTDLPILMWYEIRPTTLGRQFRYSVIFTNEDGGTATDRLMATWGRTTDIEYVYGVEVDGGGRVVSEEIQAAGHKYPRFEGHHERLHPLLWVDTDNNMVADHGTTSIRYVPAAEHFELTGASREAVMDAHPWSYRVAADEMSREGKIDDTAQPGSGHIPDPRHFVYLEGCTELRNATIAFSIRARDDAGQERWYDSDRGDPDFRVARTGCFRGAVPLAPGAGAPTAFRFRAFSHPEKDSSAPAAVTIVRVTRVFRLGADYAPGPSLLTWSGSAPLLIDRGWFEIPQ